MFKKILYSILSIFIVVGLVWACDYTQSQIWSNGETITATKLNVDIAGIITELNDLTNENIKSTAAIVYSKLNLTGLIRNADIKSDAAIVGSKLNLAIPGAIGGTTPAAGAFSTLKVGTTNQGDILYDNGTSLVRLTPGTSGKFLKTSGAAANPAWTSPGFQDIILRGFELAYTDVTHIVANAGVLLHGDTSIIKTSNTTLTIGTAADWWDGATDSYSGGQGWCYVGVDSSGNIKLLGANEPDKADVSGNTDGTKFYWYEATPLYWRVIGAVLVTTGDEFLPFYQNGNTIMHDVPVNITTTVSAGSWNEDNSCAAGMPAISTLGIFGLYSSETTTNDAGVWIRPTGSTWSTNQANGVFGHANNVPAIGGQRQCMTNGSQQIDYQNDNNVTADAATRIDVEGYVLNIR